MLQFFTLIFSNIGIGTLTLRYQFFNVQFSSDFADVRCANRAS